MKLFKLQIKAKNATAYKTAVRCGVRTEVVDAAKKYLKQGCSIKIEPANAVVICDGEEV